MCPHMKMLKRSKRVMNSRHEILKCPRPSVSLCTPYLLIWPQSRWLAVSRLDPPPPLSWEGGGGGGGGGKGGCKVCGLWGRGGWETGCGTLTWIGSNVVSTWGFFVVGFVRCLFTHRGLSRSGETRPWRISFTRAVLFFSFLYWRGRGRRGGSGRGCVSFITLTCELQGLTTNVSTCVGVNGLII